MRSLMLAVLVLCMHVVPAQEPFFTYYTTFPTGYGLFEMASGSFFTSLALPTSNASGSSIMDQQGNLVPSEVHGHVYTEETTMPHWRYARYTDNQFYFVCPYWKDTCSTNPGSAAAYPAIGRMDSLGHIANLNYYELSDPECWNVWLDLELASDGSVFTWGVSPASFFVLKADPVGLPIWGRRYAHTGGFGSVKELSNGDLLAAINLDTAGAVVARMDASGNMLWCNSYFRPGGMVQDVLVQSDDSFIVVGYTDSIGLRVNAPPPLPEYDPTLFMMKLDGAGSVQWCKGYQVEDLWYTNWRGARVVATQDNKLAVLANLGVNPFDLAHQTILMKTDLNGDTLWSRSPGVEAFDYYGLDLVACSDGGYMMQGWITGPSIALPAQANSYVCKTDSLGHVPCFETWQPVEVFDLFPVDSAVTLHSVTGLTVHPAIAQAAIWEPYVAYDPCLYNAMPPTQAGRFHLFPNPCGGILNMEFTEPLMPYSDCSVYDGMGKLVLQEPLPGTTMRFQLDLSHLGSGSYIIKLTIPDGVFHEQVMVE